MRRRLPRYGVSPALSAAIDSHTLLTPEPGDRILDAGCELGRDVRVLADRMGTDGDAIGIDYSLGMIRQARNSATDVQSAKFHQGSSTDIEAPDDHCDAVSADRVLLHVDDPQPLSRHSSPSRNAVAASA